MPVFFHYPEFFLLLIPLLLAFKNWGLTKDRATSGLRLAGAMLLLFALTGPEIDRGGEGLDVIVVVDRSRSMPAADLSSAVELIENLDKNRGPGDRVGIVAFGSSAAVERLPDSQSMHRAFEKEVSTDGSDVNAALLTALSMVHPNRPARILLLSDGEANGADPKIAARRARDREMPVPIDYRIYERARSGDVAIVELALPRTISPREPFQFDVQVFADKDALATVVVSRGGKEIAAREVRLTAGEIKGVSFRDMLEEGGFYTYEATVRVADDPVPENNRGTGVVRVESGPKLLVLNTNGDESNLVKAIRAAKIEVDVDLAKTHPLTQDSLDPYRAVVLENVPANDLGRLKMERLAQFVEDLGGGLLMTGGEQSFGTGGYYKSPLEDVLPVSMELKDEHRKLRVAICVVLDQSGSMSAPVQGGLTKMDLANQGTSEVVRLLNNEDMVSVIAVTHRADVVQELALVEQPDEIAGRVEKIQAGGGGIFIYEALEAAGEELLKAENLRTRHIILFADARDSVQEGNYQTLLEHYAEEGITVSVIGLGSDTDVHASLLQDIAKRGGGNVMFTDDPQELPRLFTQDTMSVATSTFIKKDETTQPGGIAGELYPDEARLMGDFHFKKPSSEEPEPENQPIPIDEPNPIQFPRVDGYNLTYIKPAATVAAASTDEFSAPWAAFWYRGLGRAAVITPEVAGEYTGEFGRWDFYAEFLINHARWLAGGSSLGDVHIDLEREGQDAVFTVELDQSRQSGLAKKPPRLYVVPPGLEPKQTLLPDFRWVGKGLLEARFRMEQTGTYRTLVESPGGRLTRGPAVTLPYSPEFAPRPESEGGRQILAEIAQLTGGKSRLDVPSIFDDPPSSARMMPLLPYLLILGIILLVVEIAGRRLSLWKRSPAAAPDEVTELSVDPELGYRERWFSRKRKRQIAAETEPAEAQAEGKPDKSVSQIYARAKQRAKSRLRNDGA